MRVTHVVPSLDPSSGGPARSVPELCAAQAGVGASVHLVAFAATGAEPIEGVEVTAIPPLRGTRQGLTPAFRHVVRRATAGADVVHLHSLWNPPIAVAAAAARAARVPYVISPRGMLGSVSMQRRRWLKTLAHAASGRRTLGGAAGVHFLTEQEKTDSTRVPDVPMLVLPNGVSESLETIVERGTLTRLAPQTDGKRVIAFVGRLHWSKNLDLQLDALTPVLRDRDDLCWVLVGPDEGEWDRLHTKIVDAGISQKVHRLGRLSHRETVSVMSAADACLLTSRHEAHSMAMNEAMALGTPLVLTRSVGFPLAGVAGAALEVGDDAVELRAGIERVLNDPSVASTLRTKGVTFARERLTWPSIAREMLAFYTSLVTGSRRDPR